MVKNNVAILLAAYDGEKWIEEQIYSILNQKNINFKIFISVDKSNDSTYEICKSLSIKYKNIVLNLRSENKSSAAKNFYSLIKEIDIQDYDYISLSDQDDIWFDNKIYEAIKLMEKKSAYGYSSNTLAFWENKKSMVIKKSYNMKKYDHFFESAGPGCTYVLKKDKFKTLQNFIKLNWNLVYDISQHDWFIYAFYRENNYKWVIDENYFMNYRQHFNNQFGVNVGVSNIILRLKLIYSGWYKNEIIKITNLVNSKNDYFKKKFCKNDLNYRLLIKNILQLRRRPRDIIVLFVLITIKLIKFYLKKYIV